MKAKRVLVTGGAGYIGSHTLVKLLEAGHEVCALDNHSNSSPEPIRRVQEITGRNVLTAYADVRDLAAIQSVFKAYKPDAVIHFAGLKAVGEAEQKPLEYYAVNVSGTANVLTAMNESACRTIIFSSSATVYGEPEFLPLTEEHPCRPVNVYGRTKLMAEQIIADWARATTGAKAIILRYFNPVGAHDSGMIGEDPSGIPNNLMPYIAQVATGRREALAIFGDDYHTHDGTGLRDYIHVVDLAQAHLSALDYTPGHANAGEPSQCEIFNIGTGVGFTVKEMHAAFEKACGRTLPMKIAPRRAGDIAAYYADPSRAHKLMGWTAGHTLDQMCESVWKWQSSNPMGYAPDKE